MGNQIDQDLELQVLLALMIALQTYLVFYL